MRPSLPASRAPLARRAAQLVLALTAVVLLTSCDSTTNSHPYWEDYSGTWDAFIIASTGNQFPVTITLTQDQGNLSGTFTNGGLLTGTITGTVTRDVAAFQAIQDPPCPGTFEGMVSLRGPDAFEGTYAGDGCSGPLDATITATRP